MKGIQVCSNEEPILSQRVIITKLRKYINKFVKSSSPEPLVQFQPNLAQSSVGWTGFKFVHMMGYAPFLRGDNYEIAKMHWRFQKIFFSRATGPISAKLCIFILGWRVYWIIQWRNPPLPKGRWLRNSESTLTFKIFFFRTTGPILAENLAEIIFE